jgi:hypothetical protein
LRGLISQALAFLLLDLLLPIWLLVRLSGIHAAAGCCPGSRFCGMDGLACLLGGKRTIADPALIRRNALKHGRLLLNWKSLLFSFSDVLAGGLQLAGFR